ncbi:MAG: hypothetical protein PWP23_621 [Candidatus Sumerlaeota bacterium]|nr:hypothetical protein [Candidatus Sumerlaeota bacterium]
MKTLFPARRLAAMALFLAAIATFATACRSKAPSYARVDDKAIKAATMPVNILDYDLRNRVAADIAAAERQADGRLVVMANIRNSTRKPLTVEVRTVFKNSLGLGIGDETEWEPIFFAPQQIQTIRTMSRDNTAQTFTVEVRRP